jgi:hypothetical protein
MLNSPTPFPYVGSYALLVDRDAPPPQADELVRILNRRWKRIGEAVALVAFPLRDGAGGNKEVPEGQLIDATPLTPAEQREFHDLDRLVCSRSASWCRRHKAAIARRDALKRRMIYAPHLDRLLRHMRAAAEARRAA